MQSAEETLREANESLRAQVYEQQLELEQAERVMRLGAKSFDAHRAYMAAWQVGEDTANHDTELEERLEAEAYKATEDFYEAVTAELKRLDALPPIDGQDADPQPEDK